MVNCVYAGNCTSEGCCCGSCANNKDLKEDHYYPKRHPYYYPWVPYRPFPIYGQSSGSTSGNPPECSYFIQR